MFKLGSGALCSKRWKLQGKANRKISFPKRIVHSISVERWALCGIVVAAKTRACSSAILQTPLFAIKK
jgi:hypothetical protein